jgi:hypothetical protein
MAAAPSRAENHLVVQQQSQSHFSRVQKQGTPDGSQDSAQGPSLSPPASPDPTSPYQGPADVTPPEHKPAHVADEHGPEEMEQPHFSEAQSTLAAFAPAQRVGDPNSQPEDPRAGRFDSPAEQPQPAARAQGDEAQFNTASGTIRTGMQVVDSYGRVIGEVAGLEGERLRLASSDSHGDGTAFVPLSLIEGVDGERVLMGGRGDASFGMPTE